MIRPDVYGDDTPMREAIRKSDAEHFASDVAAGAYDHLLTADDWHEINRAGESESENREAERLSLVRFRMSVRQVVAGPWGRWVSQAQRDKDREHFKAKGWA